MFRSYSSTSPSSSPVHHTSLPGSPSPNSVAPGKPTTLRQKAAYPHVVYSTNCMWVAFVREWYPSNRKRNKGSSPAAHASYKHFQCEPRCLCSWYGVVPPFKPSPVSWANFRWVGLPCLSCEPWGLLSSNHTRDSQIHTWITQSPNSV